MRSTAELRQLWSPACTRVHRGHIESAYQALDNCLRAWNYKPKAGQTFAQSCRRITGGSGYSLHAYFDDSVFRFWNGVAIPIAIAVDINSLANPYGRRLVTDMPRPMVEAILAIRTNGGHQVWRWGGNFSGNKDAMHYELVCSPQELRTGINWRTVRGGQPAPAPKPAAPPQEEEDMSVVLLSTQGEAVYAVIPAGDKLVRFQLTDPNDLRPRPDGYGPVIEVAKEDLNGIPKARDLA